MSLQITKNKNWAPMLKILRYRTSNETFKDKIVFTWLIRWKILDLFYGEINYPLLAKIKVFDCLHCSAVL
jgi:hypothetical protein